MKVQLYDSIYRQYLVKSIGKKSRMVVARAEEEGEIDSCLVVIEFQFYKMKEFWRFVTLKCEYI